MPDKVLMMSYARGLGRYGALRVPSEGHPRAVRGDIMCVPRIAFLETRCSFSSLLYPKCSFMVPINISHGVHQDGPGPIQFHEGGAEL